MLLASEPFFGKKLGSLAEKRLLDAAASLGAEHDSLVQEARGRLRRQLARELQSLAPFRFNRRKLQAHLRDEPMRAYVHYSQPAA